jgi:hypothetical protein
MIRAIFCLLVLVSSAHADDKAEAAKLFDLGKRDYNVNDFAPAIEKFKAAYKLFPDPVYLFNIAQAYRLRGTEWCALSAQFYATYQREEKDTKLRDAAKKRRDEMEACAKKHVQSKEPEPVPTPPTNGTGATLPPPTSDGSQTAPLVAPPATPTNPPVPETPPKPGGSKRFWGKALLIGGGLFVGIAGLSYLTGVDLQNTIHKCRTADVIPDKCSDDFGDVDDVKLADLERQKNEAFTLGFVIGVTGAAAMVTGYLVYRSGKRADAKHKVTVMPTRNGAIAAWTF